MSNNTKRILSGAVLFFAAALCGAVGGPLLLAMCLALSIIGLKEYQRAVGLTDKKLCTLGLVYTSVYYIGLLYLGRNGLLTGLAAGFVVFMSFLTFQYPAYRLADVLAAFAGFVYVSFLMSFLYAARLMPDGYIIFILVFVCSWLGDTFAYAFGRRFGKHKMFPVLSPAKSWEGFAAGMIGVVLVSLVYGMIVRGSLGWISKPLPVFFFCGLFGAVISAAGDLTASAIKREYGIKDYGTLIPGHGGVLDRFDSVLFAAPFIYLVISIAEKGAL